MMKKFISILLALVMTLCVFALPASAEVADIGDFTDISESDWYYTAAKSAVEKGLFSGTSPTAFSPNTDMTRAMFVTVLGRLANAEVASYTASTFEDVDTVALSWAYQYIEWAKDNNLVNGVSATEFEPNSPVTREQMATFLSRYAAFTGIDVTKYKQNALDKFYDADDVSEYARLSVAWASTYKILNGVGVIDGAPVLSPKAKATRAQVAQIIYTFTNTSFNNDVLIPEFTISGNDISEYVIIYGTQNNLQNNNRWSNSKDCAILLASFIYDTTGISLEVFKDADKAESDCEILVGITDRENEDYNLGRDELTAESFIIKTVGEKLVFTSNETYQGTLCGVYRFIEEYLGWRLYSNMIKAADHVKDLTIGDDFLFTETPSMDSRGNLWGAWYADGLNPPVNKLTIGINDISEYKIVYATGTNAALNKEVAKFLSEYIYYTVGGDRLEVVADTSEITSDCEILVGKTNREGNQIPAIDRSSMPGSGYGFTLSDKRLVLVNSSYDDSIYTAAYAFLDDYLGWTFRKNSDAWCTIADEITISSAINGTFEKEDSYFPECSSSTYPIYKSNNYYYSFDTAMTPAKLVHTIPVMAMDYSGCADNKAVRDLFNHYFWDERAYLFNEPCLTDETNIENIIKCTDAILEARPDAEWIYVCQGDGADYCKCENCLAAYAEDESTAGVYCRLLNRVAEALEDKYPDVKYVTLSYKHTVTAPKVSEATMLHKNAIVMICTDISCVSHSISSGACKLNAHFKDSCERWKILAQNSQIFVWDYLANFNYMMAINPAVYELIDNLVFYTELGVSGMVAQGTDVLHGEFPELRAYLVNKYMWNTNVTRDDLIEKMDTFLEDFYGSGWTFIREFIDSTEEVSEENDYTICGYPSMVITADQYFENAEYWNYLFDRAEALADTPEQLLNVKKSRMQLRYEKLLYTYEAYYTNGNAAQKQAYYSEAEKYISDSKAFGFNDNGHFDAGKNPSLWSYYGTK